MKYWLLVLFSLLASSAHAQTAWPVNYKSKQIEWVGHLPWPAGTHTPQQRQAVARRWYRTKLVPASAPDTGAGGTAAAARTYAGVPRRVRLLFEQGNARFQLSYDVALSVSPAGLHYVLSNFDYAWWQDDAGGAFPLAMVLDNPTVNHESLSFFHKQVADALAGW